MRKRDIEKAESLENSLRKYSLEVRSMPGINPDENMVSLIHQFIDSIRRVEYVRILPNRNLSAGSANPSNQFFDPLKAAAFYKNQDNIDEACWLVFLATHFGKNLQTSWRLARDIYGSLGTGDPWFWDRVAAMPEGPAQWINSNYSLLSSDGVSRKFGNHRKYESLRPSSARPTGNVISTYVSWINEYGGHRELFNHALALSQNNQRQAFRHLYNDMRVMSFGRTAKFDYLTMLSKLKLAPIEADSAYLEGATGPLKGAKLLFGGSFNSSLTTQDLNAELILLADKLGVGMQEMEDALCNWQKSPNRYSSFRG